MAMDLLVLLPLEFLANFPATKEVRVVQQRKATSSSSSSTSSLVEELGDAKEVQAKLRFEFTKIPALLTLKPN